jgi:RNA polymerase sigma-70 factor (ECF subfamily)
MERLIGNTEDNLSELSELELVNRADRGDGVAFELIIRRHNQALFRAAMGILADEQQAQDAVQEGYLKAFARLSSFKARSSLKTWLTRIVVNQAIDQKRRITLVMPAADNVVLFHSQPSDGEPMDHKTIDHTGPEAETSRQELKALLEKATQGLPDKYRSVFMLRDVEGLSTVEAAYCLGVNKAVIKKRLSRARAMLRQVLVKQMASCTSDLFEFDGRRCDLITQHVMGELNQQNKITV